MNQNRQLYHHAPKLSAKYHAHEKQNKYIGMTLKEYFHFTEDNNELHEIDEESQSDLSVGTPTFNQQRQTHKNQFYQHHFQSKESHEDNKHSKNAIKQNKMKKQKTKMTINLQQVIKNDKEFIKLPSIHEQKNKSVSIQLIIKDQKQMQEHSKEHHPNKLKTEESNNNNLNLLLKKEDIFKSQLNKNIMNSRRGIKSRVTATSFYHNSNHRDNARQRAKTQQQVECAIKKSFVITRYGNMMMGRSNKEELTELRKYQKSFKLKQS